MAQHYDSRFSGQLKGNSLGQTATIHEVAVGPLPRRFPENSDLIMLCPSVASKNKSPNLWAEIS